MGLVLSGLAASEPVTSTALTAAASVLVGLFVLVGIIYQARKTRGQTHRELDTGNSHTSGQGIAATQSAVEATQSAVEAVIGHVHDVSKRIDGQDREIRGIKEQQVHIADVQIKTLETVEDIRVELQTSENAVFQAHIEETAPLTDWVKAQMFASEKENP